MRVNTNLFIILAVFFVIAAGGYTIWSSIDFHLHNPGSAELGIEWVGSIGITLGAVLSGFLAFYLRLTSHSIGGVLPEDRVDAVIDDGDPEIGHFAPWSWWPLVLSSGLAFMFLGLAAGIWLCFIGAPIALLGVIGWYYEFYRGNFAR
ncbi:MAG TPA: cytochrome c oxidase subunit 4 [Pseudolysinimonas sp.]|nr:cytochrome c oxidase subunit 4 [Pseudolysinimonas sp.]